MTKSDILIFSEDPGATNCILPVLPLLQEQGVSFRLLAGGVAFEMCEKSGYSAEPVPTIETLFAETPPALVVTGTAANPDTAGLKLIDAARKCGIPTLGIVDAPMNAERRFSGRSDDPLEYVPDWIAVPDRVTAERFESLGAGKERLAVCGHPHVDAVLARADRVRSLSRPALRKKYFPQVDTVKRLVLFAGEPETHHRRNADYLLHGRGERDGRIEIVMEEFLDAAAGLNPRPACILQLHPRSRVEDFGTLASEFDDIHQGGETLEILHCADALVGLTSMLLTEAALIGRPTLSILPREEEKEWLPGIGWGVTGCVTDREALRNALPTLLSKTNTGSIERHLIRGADKNLWQLIRKILS